MGSAAVVAHGEDESVWIAGTDGSKLVNPTNNKRPDKMSGVYMQLYDIPHIHYPVIWGDFRDLNLKHLSLLTPSF